MTITRAVRNHKATGELSQAGQSHRNYQGQIDYFAVYCPTTHGVYLIPIDHVQGNYGRFRLKPTTDRRLEDARWAKDYEL